MTDTERNHCHNIIQWTCPKRQFEKHDCGRNDSGNVRVIVDVDSMEVWPENQV